MHALKLVLADDPVSARQACRQVFGEGFPNLHRTLGNVYKKKFGDSIGSAKKLSLEKRKERIKQLDDKWIVMGKPGNPNWQAYLTPDEEKLIASFLQTCNYMHLPFNRDAFKVSACIICSGMHAHTQTHTQTHMHPGSRLCDRAGEWAPSEPCRLRPLCPEFPQETPRSHGVEDFKDRAPPCEASNDES